MYGIIRNFIQIKALNYNIIVQYHRFKCNKKSLKYKNKSLLYILF